MAKARRISFVFFYVLLISIAYQIVASLIRGKVLLPSWIFMEYLQLVAFLPAYSVVLIPYLYDAFKPALISHLIFFDDTPILTDLDNQYFSKGFKYY